MRLALFVEVFEGSSVIGTAYRDFYLDSPDIASQPISQEAPIGAGCCSKGAGLMKVKLPSCAADVGAKFSLDAELNGNASVQEATLRLMQVRTTTHKKRETKRMLMREQKYGTGFTSGTQEFEICFDPGKDNMFPKDQKMSKEQAEMMKFM